MFDPSLRVLDNPFAPRPAVPDSTVQPEPPLPAFFGRVALPGALHTLEPLGPAAGPAPPHVASAPQPSAEELLSRVAMLNEATKQAMLGLMPAGYRPESGYALPPLPPLPTAGPPTTWGAWGAFPSPLDTPSWGLMPVPVPGAAPAAAPAQT